MTPAANEPFDGMDILDHLIAGRPNKPRTLFWRKPRGETVWEGARDGSWKYVAERKGPVVREFLFDLASDPAEQHNLKDSQRVQFQRLKGLYEAWERDVDAIRR